MQNLGFFQKNTAPSIVLLLILTWRHMLHLPHVEERPWTVKMCWWTDIWMPFLLALMTEVPSGVSRVMGKCQMCCGWVDYIRETPIAYVWVHVSHRTLPGWAERSFWPLSCGQRVIYDCLCSISSLQASTTVGTAQRAVSCLPDDC